MPAGAWVVHSNTPEVYGFVVARSPFGDAYVVSIIDAFEDIKACTGARMVALPTLEEMRAGYREEPFKARRSVAVTPSGSCKMDDIGTETSESTLIADPITSIAEKLSGNDTSWYPAPGQTHPADTLKKKASSTKFPLSWDGFSIEETMRSHSTTQNVPKWRFSEQRSTGSLASKRKSRKQEPPKSGKRAPSLAEHMHNEELHFLPKIRKGKKMSLFNLEQSDKIFSGTAEKSINGTASVACPHHNSPKELLAKAWPETMSSLRPPRSDRSWVECIRDGDADYHGISLLFRDHDESNLSSFQFDEVEQFCLGASLEHLVSGLGPSGSLRGAWLDDRGSKGNGEVREYCDPITATSLYRLLKRPVSTKLITTVASLNSRAEVQRPRIA